MKASSSNPRTIPPLAGATLIVIAVVLAWANSLSAPFVFDDHASIIDNPTIRRLASFEWLRPPATAGETVSGRPVLNFTFALNYAAGGLDVRGYHLVNLAIHVLSALTLFSIVRRTVGRARPPAEPSGNSRLTGTVRPTENIAGLGFALAVALLWALHPLQTESVTYVVQRAESLAGLFCLLTLYCFVRGADGSAGRKWYVLSFVSCLLGAGTKETVAAAPLIVLLYDRTFLAGSFRAAWQARGRVHAALAATWLLLIALVAMNPGRGGSAGLGAAISPGTYFLTQCDALVRYLALAVWPDPLVFDYGTATVAGFGAVWWQFLLLVTLGGATIWALVRRPALGFVGAWFFLLLAPSSSFIPVSTQTMAEHRVYLALAAVVIAMAVALEAGMRRANLPGWSRAVLAGLAVVALGAATFARNQVYQSDLSLWQDTAMKRPENSRAHHNLANAFVRVGNIDAAVTEFQRTVALRPEHAFAHFGLGTIRLARSQWSDAAADFSAAVAADSHYAAARIGCAQALAKLGRTDEAIAQYQAALVDEPGNGEAQFAVGNLLAKQQRFEPAMTAYRAALASDPTHVQARANLANCQLMLGQLDEAIANYEEALRARPADAALQRNLAVARELRAQRR